MDQQQFEADETVSLIRSLFATVQVFSGLFTTSSASLFTVFTGFLGNDKIDLEGMTRLLRLNSSFAFASQRSCYKMMFRQDILFDLAMISMI